MGISDLIGKGNNEPYDFEKECKKFKEALKEVFEFFGAKTVTEKVLLRDCVASVIAEGVRKITGREVDEDGKDADEDDLNTFMESVGIDDFDEADLVLLDKFIYGDDANGEFNINLQYDSTFRSFLECFLNNTLAGNRCNKDTSGLSVFHAILDILFKHFKTSNIYLNEDSTIFMEIR